jgi:hypothetical protein
LDSGQISGFSSSHCRSDAGTEPCHDSSVWKFLHGEALEPVFARYYGWRARAPEN